MRLTIAIHPGSAKELVTIKTADQEIIHVEAISGYVTPL